MTPHTTARKVNMSEPSREMTLKASHQLFVEYTGLKLQLIDKITGKTNIGG